MTIDYIAVTLKDGRTATLTTKIIEMIADMQAGDFKAAAMHEALILDLRELNDLVLHKADDLDIDPALRLSMLQTIDQIHASLSRIRHAEALCMHGLGIHMPAGTVTRLDTLDPKEHEERVEPAPAEAAEPEKGTESSEV